MSGMSSEHLSGCELELSGEASIIVVMMFMNKVLIR